MVLWPAGCAVWVTGLSTPLCSAGAVPSLDCELLPE